MFYNCFMIFFFKQLSAFIFLTILFQQQTTTIIITISIYKTNLKKMILVEVFLKNIFLAKTSNKKCMKINTSYQIDCKFTNFQIINKNI